MCERHIHSYERERSARNQEAKQKPLPCFDDTPFDDEAMLSLKKTARTTTARRFNCWHVPLLVWWRVWLLFLPFLRPPSLAHIIANGYYNVNRDLWESGGSIWWRRRSGELRTVEYSYFHRNCRSLPVWYMCYTRQGVCYGAEHNSFIFSCGYLEMPSALDR